MNKAKTLADSRLRRLPSVDQLLRTTEVAALRKSVGNKRLTTIARLVIAQMRAEILAEPEGAQNVDEMNLLQDAVRRTIESSQSDRSAQMQRVINATGVVLHTNLGRAPLSDAVRNALSETALRYCTLEYDPAVGTRGTRGGRVESLLCELTGAEDALVVNNCAAAALLILKVLAGDGETIVSRGELVEIGGDFRVPDVMSSSGTRMVEVGTTNRTHLQDYEKAINPNTRLIMRVHPSNYRIVGFASTPSLEELAALAHQSTLPLYEDAGSGQLIDLSSFGVVDESTVDDSIRAGADIVSFSGDKLLGAAQAGLIVGRREIIEKLRTHALYRALRSDKLRLAALEATLTAYLRGTAVAEVPALRMLAMTVEQIEERSRSVIRQIANTSLDIELLQGESAIGGGAAPTSKISTVLIAATHQDYSAQELERRLRLSYPPIIGRIADDRVLLDLRTVFPDEENLLVKALNELN